MKIQACYIGVTVLVSLRSLIGIQITTFKTQYMDAKQLLFSLFACKVSQSRCWYTWLFFCLFERMTGVKKFSSTGLDSLFVIVLFQIQSLTYGYDASKLMVQGEVNRTMYGHSFLNISGMTMANCLEHCLANCLCLSFQICGHTSECQLCTANKYSNPHAMRQFEGCTSYNFRNQEVKVKLIRLKLAHVVTLFSLGPIAVWIYFMIDYKTLEHWW